MRLHIIAMALSWILLSCEIPQETQSLHIRLEHTPEITNLGIDAKRTLYYIYQNAISSQDISIETSKITLEVDKTNVLPVLACVQSNLIRSSIDQCPLALGGTYPFNIHSDTLSSLMLEKYHKAQVASLLLQLYSKQVAINILNIPKLYSIINKYSKDHPINFETFQEYIKRQKLSTWAVRSLNRHSVLLDTIPSRNWISMSYWIDDIAPQDQELFLYSGKWMFISKENNRYQVLQIHIDEAGKYSLIQ